MAKRYILGKEKKERQKRIVHVRLGLVAQTHHRLWRHNLTKGQFFGPSLNFYVLSDQNLAQWEGGEPIVRCVYSSD